MSGPRIEKRSPAFDDLRRHALYLAGVTDASVGMRFLESVEKAFATLAKMPSMGRIRRFPHFELGEMRSWPVPGFERYLIFYRELPNGVEVIRIIHGMRNLDRIFGGESNSDANA